MYTTNITVPDIPTARCLVPEYLEFATQMLDTNLAGAHALVTGGTKGIGKALVEALLEEGCNVSFCARSVHGREFNRLAEEHNTNVHGSKVDLGSRSAIHKWVDTSSKRYGRIDVVIANASSTPFDPSSETWQNEYNTDLMGSIHLVEAATPHLEKSMHPSIVVVSSLMAQDTSPSPPALYTLMKAAQLEHVQRLSQTLGPKGIRVNAISPGSLDTLGVAAQAPDKMHHTWPAADKASSISSLSFGSPDDVAKVAIFLASPLSGFVQDTNIHVDGGVCNEPSLVGSSRSCGRSKQRLQWSGPS